MLPRPVIELPGETPKPPVIVVGPVLVTAWPPRTAKLAAVPRLSAHAAPAKSNNPNATAIAGADLKNFILVLLGEIISVIHDAKRPKTKFLSNCGQASIFHVVEATGSE